MRVLIIILISLFGFEGISQFPGFKLERLEWADGKDYFIGTIDSTGQPYYIHKDSLSNFLDDQQISISNDTIYLEKGGFITLLDNDPNNELQDLNSVIDVGGTVSGDRIMTFVDGTLLFNDNGNAEIIIPHLANAPPSGTNGNMYYDSTIQKLCVRHVGSWKCFGEDQVLSISNDTIYLSSNGDFVDLSPYLDNTDNQQLSVSFDIPTAQFSISLTNGGSYNLSLFSLEDRLQLQGNLLSIIGNAGPAIDLSPYLDNTDEQVLSWAQSNDTLKLTLTNSGTLNIPISDLEIDPVFAASVAATITQTDIDNWNNHIANDLDLDPTNERDSLVITDVDFNTKIFGGNVGPDGTQYRIHLISDGTYIYDSGGGGSGSPDQNLSIDYGVDSLYLSGGGAVSLSVYRNGNYKCATVTGQTGSTIASPLTLPGDAQKRMILINGIKTREVVTRTHYQEITISGQNILLHEASISSDFFDVCTE